MDICTFDNICKDTNLFKLQIFPFCVCLFHYVTFKENMEIVKHTKILHPSVDDYFEHFDGSQYLPRPWLRLGGVDAIKINFPLVVF